MADFDHTPAPSEEAWDEQLAARRARYGLALFAIYLVLYGGFMLLIAFAPSVMATTLGGINLAIWYGLGLIAAALVLALVYAWLCRANAMPPRPEDRP
jgi:uncharacterized membrane protein (DUF485 family)